ncbi:hypothetical protein Q5H92_12215 [Hymenobacter sp. M29]|uniref:Lipoprotein n=1 Tax=Hymenobacter mellowenesis TaxID=3063995 RepID=A0ABT9AC60_9BACT|nr:hypothetical protein [Hymenobacter sp. M29]MDO7847128.1 hypothetical protein [Hymenobacter sp. M29]
MNKKLKYTLLSALVAFGAATGSCQRLDPAQELAAKSDPQKGSGDLVAAMASDEVVRAFLDANEQFLNADETYYASLSEAGKAARRAQLQAAFDRGTDLPDPYRTPVQVEAFHDNQAQRAAQIRARFPQLALLSDEEREDVKMEVIETVRKTMASAASSSTAGHAGYTGCSWYNYDHGGTNTTHKGCRAGYDGFMGYVVASAK